MKKTMIHIPHRLLRWLGPAMAAVLILGGNTSDAQVVERPVMGLQMIRGGFIRGGQAASSQENVDVEAGALLKTDPELEEILEQAERIRNDGNYRVASQLWQAVLRRSGDALYSSDELTYFSLVRQVEGILANLPPEGLAAYRVTADAEAKEILAEADGIEDVVAMNRVVREYFISSIGDDTAFELGCVYLDQFDFIGARRMFEKIVDQYPDPSIPLDEVYGRIGLCHTFLGDLVRADEALNKADTINATNIRVAMVRQIMIELKNGDRDMAHWTNNHSVSKTEWGLRMGNPKRHGTMAPIPDAMMENDLVAVWQYYFRPEDKYKKSADVTGVMLSGSRASDDDVADTKADVEKNLVESWRAKSWRPAGHLLFNGDRVYFKTGADVAVWSRKKISHIAKSDANQSNIDSAIVWRSVWNNSFEIDYATQMEQTIRKNYGGIGRATSGQAQSPFPQPMTSTEVQLFGDQIYQQMSILDDQIYVVEGEKFDSKNGHTAKPPRIQWNASYRRSRTNFLTAYDATTGEVQWRLPRDSQNKKEHEDGEESEWLDSGGFMAAPIRFANMVLVPVNQGGAISIYALDPGNGGKTIWKSFLCDEPEAGSVPWSSIDLSLDGSDLFVSCGMGVVFVLDPATGLVRFAKRYRRVGKPDQLYRRVNWSANRVEFSGWSSDVVIPYGRQMICFCSDTDSIAAYDRNSGQLIWRSEMSPIGFKVDYVLGVQGSMLYAAGHETIIAYDLEGEGRMVWGADQLFEGKQSLGRGMVTSKGIYLPVEDNIYLFDLDGDKGKANVLAKVHVELGTNAPVGNLYSDGERFWVHGANRIYALGLPPDD